MNTEELIQWLLEGDVSIQYQTHLDLLGEEKPELQKRIATEGWGAGFLSKQDENGHWGDRFYQPKWISTHYTLLDLRLLKLPQDNEQAQRSVQIILDEDRGPDGGVNPSRFIAQADLCVNGMFLHYACWFGANEKDLESVIDFVLTQRLPDGGFNCRLNRSGARHSSLHSTLSMCEGIREYAEQGYTYRLDELLEAERTAREFMLMHQLYLSDRTGEIINKDFLKLTFPGRWKYDILRALDYFRLTGMPFDKRLQPAIDVLLKKRMKKGAWPNQARHPGKVHFDMEPAGRPGRWNTLRVLRSFKAFGIPLES